MKYIFITLWILFLSIAIWSRPTNEPEPVACTDLATFIKEDYKYKRLNE